MRLLLKTHNSGIRKRIRCSFKDFESFEWDFVIFANNFLFLGYLPGIIRVYRVSDRQYWLTFNDNVGLE